MRDRFATSLMQISEVTVERVRELFIEHGDRLDVEVCLNDLGSILYGSRILKKWEPRTGTAFLSQRPSETAAFRHELQPSYARARFQSLLATLIGSMPDSFHHARSSPAR